MKECIYPREYKKKYIYPIARQIFHIREHTDLVTFIGFLTIKIETMVEKKT